MPQPVIISACRTPIGSFMGALSSCKATELGSLVVREAIRRAGVDPAEVDEVILGNVISAGLGQNPARQAALHAGIPSSVGALTINKVCGSGLKAVMLAAQSIRLGETEVCVAGGMESMSNAPYLLFQMRGGARMGNSPAVDSLIHDGLWCALENCHMGSTAEWVAEKYGITREQQDEYAYHSHMKAVAATASCQFGREIVPVATGKAEFAKDERPRAETSIETLARLKPAFQKNGTVTAGNAPGVNDGAAAVLITSEKKAAALGLKVMARIAGQAFSGVDPSRVMMAPVPAFRKLLKTTGWTVDDIDRFELNEAFAVQALAVTRELGLDPARVNVRGGAVALGHPIGASGARILVTLLHALEDSGGKRGVAMLCMGGGNGLALAVELV
jgi:acetyl-CoA C-acetyltransferase